MELGAYSYLLKPIDDRKLKEAMESVETKLQISKLEKENYFNLNRSSKKDKDLLRKQYIYEMITKNRGNLKMYDAQLQEAYASAKETLHKKLILGGGTIYFASGNQTVSDSHHFSGTGSNIILEESIIKGLYQGDALQIKQYLDDYHAPYLNSRDGNIKKLHKMHLNIFDFKESNVKNAYTKKEILVINILYEVYGT